MADMTTRASIIAGLAVLSLNVVGAIGWFTVAYHPYTVSAEVALASLCYVMWVGWPLSITALTIAIIAGSYARSWRPVGAAISSFLPYVLIIAAANRGVFPSI
jgi:hypothetical protein